MGNSGNPLVPSGVLDPPRQRGVVSKQIITGLATVLAYMCAAYAGHVIGKVDHLSGELLSLKVQLEVFRAEHNGMMRNNEKSIEEHDKRIKGTNSRITALELSHGLLSNRVGSYHDPSP